MAGLMTGYASITDFNLKPLQVFHDHLYKEIPKMYGKVGIIGKKASEVHDGGETNVSIGVTHEFGAPASNIPRRSFIKYTLMQARKNALAKDFEAILKQVIQQSLQQEKNLSFKQAYKRALRLITLKAEGYVIEAFETQGFGTWPPLSPQTIKARAMKKYGSRLAKAQSSVASIKRSIGANTCIRRMLDLQKSLNKANNRLNKVQDTMKNIQVTPLVDTGELKRSISSVVITKSL